MRVPSSPVARGGLIALIALVAGVLAYALTRGDGSREAVAPTPSPPATQPADEPPARAVRPPIPAEVLTGTQLTAIAELEPRPVYWAGSQARARYELTRAADGSTFIRYLTGVAEAGDPSAAYLVVATYPREDGFADVSAAAEQHGSVALPAGGLAVLDPRRPRSVYLSYPGAEYQVEVYAPLPTTALALVKTGRIVPVGGGTPVATDVARRVSVSALRDLARSAEIFWAGVRPGSTYELTRVRSGSTFVRYLPAGVKVGDPRPRFLVVATYPDADAFARVRMAGARAGAVVVELANGALAVYDRGRPTSVYVAYPDLDQQIEVFSPKPGEARALVESGRIARIR